MRVSVPFLVYVNVEVEADSEDEALELAMEEAYVDSYAGNGGDNKLVGVYGDNTSIEVGDLAIGTFNLDAEVVS